MNPEKALKAIFILSLAGLLFSGYLSYMELFAVGCKNALVQCGSTFSLFQLPACVYGFFMYLIIFFVSLLGLRKKNKKTP